MALITTPGQLKQQGEFYLQLASMTRAGVSIVQGVEVLRKSPPNRRLGVIAGRISEVIQRGATFTEAMQSSGHHLPEFDVALIEAGEASGRLPECLRLLGEFYQERARLISQMISALIYPVFLLGFAILIFPPSLLSELVWYGRTGKYFASKLQIALPICAIAFVLIWALQAHRARGWRNFLERLFGIIPVVAGTQRDLALARLCAALEALINAGVTIIEAWDISARATGSQKIERAVAEARPRIEQGETPGDVIAAQRVYPDLFSSMYRTGEVSGQLDDSLRRLYRHYMESATTSMQRIAIFVPKIAYLVIALIIAYHVLSFYSNYFNTLNEIMK
jgi:type II secretory pathway component PulF